CAASPRSLHSRGAPRPLSSFPTRRSSDLRPQLQGPLGGLPVVLAEEVVPAQLVKSAGQGAFALFFAPHRRVGRKDRRRGKKQGVPLPQGSLHPQSLLSGGSVNFVHAARFLQFFPSGRRILYDEKKAAAHSAAP